MKRLENLEKIPIIHKAITDSNQEYENNFTNYYEEDKLNREKRQETQPGIFQKRK